MVLGVVLALIGVGVTSLVLFAGSDSDSATSTPTFSDEIRRFPYAP